ncbi:DUF2059 domain-containing protein [Xanthobacter sp. TB0139]|uniref:DUF2059 domain-containing protein n=1 Tax=Xanthobacter sp. TB0139 TaxID=3459178 RepID=UPI0040390AEC
MPSFHRVRRASGLFSAALLSVALLGGSPLGTTLAQAQQAAAEPTAKQLALAKDIVIANGEARAFDGVIGNIVDGAALSFLQTNPDLAQQLRDAAVAVRPEFEERKSELLELLAKIYAARFTEAELQEALDFYNSPVGMKMVADRPAIVQDAIRSIQIWGATMNVEAVERVRAEMKKKGFDI